MDMRYKHVNQLQKEGLIKVIFICSEENRYMTQSYSVSIHSSILHDYIRGEFWTRVGDNNLRRPLSAIICYKYYNLYFCMKL